MNEVMLYYVKSLMLLKFEDRVKIYLNMRLPRFRPTDRHRKAVSLASVAFCCIPG